MIDKSILSHLSVAQREALPDLHKPALAGPLAAFFAAGLEDGLANFAAKVEGLADVLARAPRPWREAAYQWLWVWVEPSVPAAEAQQVLGAAVDLRPLLEGDQGIQAAKRLLDQLSTLDAGAAPEPPASAQDVARAGRIVDDLAREKAFDDFSVRTILTCAGMLKELAFSAIAPHLAQLLEAVRQLWYAQRLTAINDALLEILDQAPSADALAELLRLEIAAIDEVVRGHVTEFLEELRRGTPFLGPDSTAKQGLRLALAPSPS